MPNNKRSSQLILVRHGQSQYNLENRFTGFFDSKLTEQGVAEGQACGKLLREFPIEHSFSSGLSRSIQTQNMILSELQSQPNIHQSDSLNERDYGLLTGQNKSEAIKIHGEKKVQKWRRGFHDMPPGGESLSMVKFRVMQYYTEHIKPLIENGNTILIVAHGNSLRSLIGHLMNFDELQYEKIEISWATPWIFDFTENNLTSLKVIQSSQKRGINSLPEDKKNSLRVSF